MKKHIVKIFSTVMIAVLLSVSVFAQQKTVLPVDEYEKAVQAKATQVLDVRRPDEFKEGHIKGAVNANWQDQKTFVEQAGKLDKSKPVYVYCLSGVRSDKAAIWLIEHGFTQVVNLKGGIEAWKEAKKPLEQ